MKDDEVEIHRDTAAGKMWSVNLITGESSWLKEGEEEKVRTC